MTKAVPPRRPVVMFSTGELMDGNALALVRLTWYKQGRPRWVEEFCIWDTPEGYSVVELALREAVEQGVDVLVIASQEAEAFGLSEC